MHYNCCCCCCAYAAIWQEKLNEKKGNDPDECRLVSVQLVDSLAQFWCPPGLTNPTRQLVMILDPSQSMNLDFTSPDNSSSTYGITGYRGNEGNARVHWDFPYERQFLGRPRNAGITTTDRRKNNFLPPAAVSVYAKRDEGEKATTLPVTLSKPVVEIIILAMSFDIQY
ncbi:Hemin import ATP-binding protein HmuV [Trichinella pseudospiralis]